MARWKCSALDIWWTVAALLSTCLLQQQQAWADKPEFSANLYTATLNEKSGATDLVALPCSDDDKDTTMVVLQNVNPSSPCGGCFSVNACRTPGTGYCLVYDVVDTLNRNRVNSYNITVGCTDGTPGNGNKDTATVIISIVKNSPPTFVPDRSVDTVTVADTKKQKAGYIIMDVSAVDVDNDNIVYSMVTVPASENFEIGSGDGIIRAKNDLISECLNSISFFVTVTDKFNPIGQELAIHATLEGSNQKPDLTNLDVTLHVPEDQGASVIHTIAATDDENLKKLTYTFTPNPPENAAYFEVDDEKLKVKGTLDYETTSVRDTDLTIVASDGYCTSEPRNVHVTVTDVNEPPILQPADKGYWVYEGTTLIALDKSLFSIDWDVIDEDEDDTHTYEITGGNTGGMFSIHPTTGQITVNTDYELDLNTMPDKQSLRVEVTDKGGLTDKTTVDLNFVDKNDKYPVIQEGDFGFTVCEDKRVGATLDTLTCTDEDLDPPNHDVYITGGGSGITVLSGGSIILTSVPALGQTISTTANCHDRGFYPGPLTSLSPIPISVTTVECLTTKTPTQAPTAAPQTTAPEATTMTPPLGGDDDNIASWVEENLWWIILACLLAMLLLPLLLYMCYIYCWAHCLRCCCREQWCVRRQRPSRPHRKVIKPRAVTPVETPPPPVATVGPPYLYDFWKERYPDDDYRDSPDRKAKPRPRSSDSRASNGTGSKRDPETPRGLSPPPKKSTRCCNIL